MFKELLCSLRVMADWLIEAEVRIAAMESTSTYSKPLVLLPGRAIVVWLLNAAQMRRCPVAKATSVMRSGSQLLERGLLAPCSCHRRRSAGCGCPETVRLELMLDVVTHTRDAARMRKLRTLH
jgi:transposase